VSRHITTTHRINAYALQVLDSTEEASSDENATALTGGGFNAGVPRLWHAIATRSVAIAGEKFHEIQRSGVTMHSDRRPNRGPLPGRLRTCTGTRLIFSLEVLACWVSRGWGRLCPGDPPRSWVPLGGFRSFAPEPVSVSYKRVSAYPFRGNGGGARRSRPRSTTRGSTSARSHGFTDWIVCLCLVSERLREGRF
jgi:hypothetical protein